MPPRPPAARAPVLLTIADVADQLQVSTKTVRRMITRGDLPVHRLGRQIRVAPHDLGAFLHRSREMVST